MSVAEIIQEIRKLSREDKEQVIDALLREREISKKSTEERQEELLRRLHAKGVIKSIPKREIADRNFEPVSIKGKPLSETIIEERR